MAPHIGKVSPWLYLLLAHLVADFILQPYVLVRLKRQPVGLAIHSGVHAMITAVLVAPFLPRWWLIIPLMTVAHYFIDGMKMESGYSRGPVSLLVFLVDQAVHLVVLVLVVFLAGLRLDTTISYGPRGLTPILYYAVPYVAATFAGAILLYQLAVAYETRSNPEELLAPRLRVAGIVERALALTVVLFLTPALWWFGAVPYAVRLWTGREHQRPGRQRGRWVEAAGSLAFVVVLGLLFRQGVGR